MRIKRLFTFIITAFSLIFFLAACDDIPLEAPKKLQTPVVTLDENIASWNSITGADKYEVSLNGECTYVDTTITSRELNENDTLKVRAIGNLINYLDSEWSNTVKYEIKSDTPETKKFTVTFDGNFAEAQEIEEGSKAVKPQDPTKDGYTFGGWYTDSQCTKVFDFNTVITADITLYAKWIEVTVTPPAVLKFTVSFDGASVASQEIEEGSKATKPTDPTKDGYEFGGWYTDSAYTTEYNFDTAVTANITLYAKWIEVKQLDTIAEIKAKRDSSEADITVEFIGKVIGFDSMGYAHLADSTGAIYVRVKDTYLALGNVVKIKGNCAIYQGSENYLEYTRQINSVDTIELINDSSFDTLASSTVDIATLAGLNVDTGDLYHGNLVTTIGTVVAGETKYTYYLVDDNNNKIQIHHYSTNFNNSIADEDNEFNQYIGQKIKLTGIIYRYYTHENIWTIQCIGLDDQISSPYTDIFDIEANGNYDVKGVVAAVTSQSFVIQDQTGSMLVYMGNTWTCDVKVGDLLALNGDTSVYCSAVQFKNNVTYNVIGQEDVIYPDIEKIDANYINTKLQLSELENEYVELRGLLTASGSYYNVKTSVENVYGSISYPSMDLSGLINKYVIVRGYFNNISGSSTKYLNISATEVLESTTGSKIQAEYDALKAGTTTTHTNWDFEATVVDMDATYFNSTYNSYNVRMIVDVDGVYIGIYDGQINGSYPKSIEGLEVGTIVRIIGMIEENYTFTSGSITADIEISKPEISWDIDTALEDDVDNVKFLMINDTHGAFLDSTDGYSIGRVDSLLDTLKAKNGEYIFIQNGDAFQGSYVCGETYGRPLIEAFNAMELDAFVIGNHEFDWGLDKIQQYKDDDLSNGEANFPFLGANIYYAGTQTRPDWIDAYTIVNYGDVKVGIIGVIGESQESSILGSMVAAYNFVECEDIIESTAKQLRATEGCDVVVVATHDHDDTFNSTIAALSGDAKIDAIFTAHTHQYIDSSVTRSDNIAIPVVQNTHKNTRAVDVTLYLDENKEMNSYNTTFYYPNNYQISSDIQQIINSYSDIIAKSNEVIGTVSSNIYKATLGQYTLDAMLEYEYNQAISGVDVAIMNVGGIRSTIDSGDITNADVFEVLPFNNAVVLVNLSGKLIKSLCSENSGFLYVETTNEVGSYTNLDDNTIYQLAVIDYVFEGSYYYQFDNLTTDDYIYSGIIARNLLIDYIDALY